MSLIAPLDQSSQCLAGRARVLQVLSRCETVNSIVALLSINFHELETDVKKEQQLRQKAGAGSESVLMTNISNGPSLEFERSDATKKLRLVLFELLSLIASTNSSSSATSPALTHKSSELFDHRVFLPELSDVLAIALAELPALLHPTDVCEALLRLKYGPEMICQVSLRPSILSKDQEWTTTKYVFGIFYIFFGILHFSGKFWLILVSPRNPHRKSPACFRLWPTRVTVSCAW